MLYRQNSRVLQNCIWNPATRRRSGQSEMPCAERIRSQFCCQNASEKVKKCFSQICGQYPTKDSCTVSLQRWKQWPLREIWKPGPQFGWQSVCKTVHANKIDSNTDCGHLGVPMHSTSVKPRSVMKRRRNSHVSSENKYCWNVSRHIRERQLIDAGCSISPIYHDHLQPGICCFLGVTETWRGISVRRQSNCMS